MTGERPKPFAKRSLGQNFLVDPNYIAKIVNAVSPVAGDFVVEIGPGRGAITRELIGSGASVVAVELDQDLAELLRSEFAGAPNFRLVEADAVKADFQQLVPAGATAKLVANLPYYISTAILQRLIEQRELFSSMVLMFQREVVERLTAGPGESERGFLTVLAQTFVTIEHLFDVPPAAFRPQPKIWSSVASFVPSGEKLEGEKDYRRLISAAFAQKRKTIQNNLKSLYPDASRTLIEAGIDPTRRAETLTNDEWLRLHGAIRLNHG